MAFLALATRTRSTRYSGCAFAGSVCGLFCYAQHDRNITKGRPWRLYGAKKNAAAAYRVDYDRLKRPRAR